MSPKLLPQAEWQQVKVLFDEALSIEPIARPGFVETRCPDAAVRAEVLALLAAHDDTDGFLEPEVGPLRPGRRFGPYEIRALVGGGGMGDVYRAHDLRLGRDVALKVVRGRLVGADARRRFEREARAIAALSHPNVLAVHDFGDDGAMPYLVTELLDGETLRARLARGLPRLEQALSWARQIALGLAAAHEQGLVHRDLKPDNVFLLRDGRVKILDFGLARPLPGNAKLGDGESWSMPGFVVGTAAYLSPEQARCKPVAAPSDIFSFGVLLFELLTGRQVFRRLTVVETLQAVIEDEPPAPSVAKPSVPPWLDRVVARCLAKEPGERFQSAADLAFVLREGTPEEAPARRWPLPVLVGTLAAVATFALVTMSKPAGPARIRPLTFSGHDREPAVSPDGRILAFTSDRDGRSRIWLKDLGSGTESALTDGPDESPRFSPDGSQLLFTRSRALYRVALVGDVLHPMVDDAANGDWSPDGRQVAFVRAKGLKSSIMMAGVDGSAVRELAVVEQRQPVPRFSPDGKYVAVTGLVQLPGVPQNVALVPVDGSPVRELQTGRIGRISAVAWDGPDALLYSEAQSVNGNVSGGTARIVRQRIGDGSARTLVWTLESSLVLDRWPGRGVVVDLRSSGQKLREIGPQGERFLSGGTASDRQPVFEPDGEHVIFTSNRGSNLDVWRVSRKDGTIQRLTDDPADDWDPALSSDGATLLFSSNRSGNHEVWMADADGAHARQVTHDGLDAENPSLTPDGQWVIYACGAPGRAGIWRIRPDGTEARLLIPDAMLPSLSPDGTRIAYQLNRPREVVVGLTSVEGQVLPFEIHIDAPRPAPPVMGRARWIDDDTLAFLGQDARGHSGVYAQPVRLDEDTRDRRRVLGGFAEDRVTESFALRGDTLVLAEWDRMSDLVAITDL